MFPDSTPHKRYLDAVTTEQPILIRDRDHHAALANTRALDLANITAETLDSDGGTIERDASVTRRTPQGDPPGAW